MGMDSGVIQEIKARLDLADIVRRYVELRPVSGRFMGVCPFHHETKPSFSVHPEQGFYYCFGCQATGDVIDFYARMNGLDFREALEALAAEAGVELTRHEADPAFEARKKERTDCLAMHSLAADYFRRVLAGPAGEPAREYIARRKLVPEIVERFGLGYSPADWQGVQNFLRSKGYQPEVAVTAGLLSKNDSGRTYDRFRDRLIFPISDVAGRIIAFGGRIIGDGEPKYLNSSDSPIYKKGEHLYGMAQARPAIARVRRAYLTEGYVDVIALHQAGFPESVGVLGTALTPAQVKRLGGFCNRVDLVFDGDAAGRKAAFRSAEMILAQGLTCRVVLLPQGEDVDDVLKTRGREGFEACVREAGDGLDFCMQELKGTGSAREILTWVEEFTAKLQDGSFRAYFLPRLVRGLGLDERELRGMFSGPQGSERHVSRRNPAAKQAGRLEHGLARDKSFLAFAVRHPEQRHELDELGLAEVLETDWARELWARMLATPDEALFAELPHEDKVFWAENSLAQDRSGQAAGEEWQDVCTTLGGLRCETRRSNLLVALREAQGRGDSAEAQRLMQALSALNAEWQGRVDEQL